MEENLQLSNYLNEYLKMDKLQFAIMISGKWGCGKTYYIKKKIEEWVASSEGDGRELRAGQQEHETEVGTQVILHS